MRSYMRKVIFNLLSPTRSVLDTFEAGARAVSVEWDSVLQEFRIRIDDYSIITEHFSDLISYDTGLLIINFVSAPTFIIGNVLSSREFNIHSFVELKYFFEELEDELENSEV